MAYDYLNKAGLTALWNKIKNKFVAKDGDKVLSDNNFTDALLSKLNSLYSVDAIQLTNQDLNNYRDDTKFYYAGGGNTCAHSPGGSGTQFGMIVMRIAGGYYAQIAVVDGVLYNRFYNASTWSSWYEIYSSLNKPTASDIGALGKSETAASATKLATARNITVNLASTSAASFNGTANVTPGVSGILPVAHGGTGVNTVQALKDLVITTVSDEEALAYWGV